MNTWSNMPWSFSQSVVEVCALNKLLVLNYNNTTWTDWIDLLLQGKHACVCSVPALASRDPLQLHHRVGVQIQVTQREWRYSANPTKGQKKRFWGFRMLSSIAFSRQKTDGVTHCFVPSVVGQGLSKPTSHYLFKWHWKFMSTDSALLHSCSNVFI